MDRTLAVYGRKCTVLYGCAYGDGRNRKTGNEGAYGTVTGHRIPVPYPEFYGYGADP
jgi:hypothetical protein